MADRNSTLGDLPGQDLSDASSEPLPETPPPTDIYDDGTGLEDLSAPSPSPIESIGNDAQAPESASTPESSPGAIRALSSNARSGISAMKEVQRAKRDHANARDRLAKLETEIDADNQTLEHRRQIEQDYESIIGEQSAIQEQANANLERLQSDVSSNNSTLRSLQNKLTKLKKTHAKELKPYQELSDSAKERADADQKAVASARREARSADKHVKDLTQQRDESIARANKAVQTANAQLSKLQTRADELKGDLASNAPELEKINKEIAAQEEQRDRSQAEAKEIPVKAQSSIEAAQDSLAQALSKLETVKKTAENSKKEASSKANEYRKLKASYKRDEDDLSSKISDTQKQLRSLNTQMTKEKNTIQAAQAVIDEAEAIHSTPEETQNLADKISDNSAAADVQRQQVEALAQNEIDVRERTKQSRRRLIGIIILAVMVAMAIIGFIYFCMGQGG